MQSGGDGSRRSTRTSSRLAGYETPEDNEHEDREASGSDDNVATGRRTRSAMEPVARSSTRSSPRIRRRRRVSYQEVPSDADELEKNEDSEDSEDSEEEEEANKKYRGSDRGTTPGVKIESLGDATEAFGIADDEAKNLPSFADRFGQQSLTTKNPKGAERTTNVVVKACNKLVDAFVGAASRNDLIAAVGSKLLRQSMLSDELSVTGKSTEIVRENSAPK